MIKGLVGALLLCGLLVGAVVYDMALNEGRGLARLMGRDALVAACLPDLQARLTARGFTPVDVVLGAPASMGFAAGLFGSDRVLSGPFTFSDGPNGQRIDGTLVCRVHGPSVTVDLAVDALPLRAA